MTNHCPPYQDLKTVAANVCLGESTIERLMGQGQFPKPCRMVGGKRLWAWRDIERFMCEDMIEGEFTEGRVHAGMEKVRAESRVRNVR